MIRLFFKVSVVLIAVLVALSNQGFASTTKLERPLIAPFLPAQVGKHPMSVDELINVDLDLNQLETIQWVDNNHFIYKMRSHSSGHLNQIYLYDLTKKQSTTLIVGENPVVSSNKQQLLFTQNDASNQKQLWIFNLLTHQSKKLSKVAGGLSGYYDYHYSYIWSPDAKSVVLAHQAYLEDPLFWRDKTLGKTEIELFDVESSNSEKLAEVDGQVFDLLWRPHSSEIMYAKQRVALFYHDLKNDVSIEALDINNKKQRTLMHFDGLQQSLRLTASHDGQKLAFTYDADHPIFTYLLSVGVLSADANVESNPKATLRITHDIKLKNPKWSADDKFIYSRRSYGPYAQIYKIDSLTGEMTQLTSDPINIATFALSPDGKKLAWIGEDAHGTAYLRLAATHAPQTQDLIKTRSVSKATSLSEVQEVGWPTVDYPTPMRGLLVLPLHYQKGVHYPMIVDIHGGDSGASLDVFLGGGLFCTTPLEWQWWASKGYAVFIPEFRSSGAFGSLAFDRDLFQKHDRLGGDLKDVESGVDYLIQQGIADPARLVMVGHSAGGLRANWFATATHRYKTIISNEGWADELEMYLKLPFLDKSMYEAYGGTPQEVPENYIKNSAVYFAEQVTTPILFIMGNPDKGGVDLFKTVEKFYNLIKAKGIPTEYVEYPDEGHSVDKPENKKELLERISRWIEGYLKDE